MFERIARQSLVEATASGAFDHLQGAGRPFSFDPARQPVGEQWAGFRILQNSGLLPEWLELAREIERDSNALATIDDRHRDTLALVASSDAPERLLSAARLLRERYREAAGALRRKQDRFNVMAPAISCERPGIWVEHELERLDDRARAAGSAAGLDPDPWEASSCPEA